MRKKWLLIVILICIVSVSICVYIMDAAYRWSGRLREAIRAEDTPMALQLIEEGIQKGYSMDTLCMRPSLLWSFLETAPETPLQTACENGNYLVAERLLEEGASVRPVEGGSSREPIFYVLLKHYDSDDGRLIQLLIDHGALLYDHQLGDHFLLEAVTRSPQQYTGEKTQKLEAIITANTVRKLQKASLRYSCSFPNMGIAMIQTAAGKMRCTGLQSWAIGIW